MSGVKVSKALRIGAAGEQPVTSRVNPVTGVVRNLSASGKAVPLFGKPRSHVVKPSPGPLVGSASALTYTTNQLLCSPVKFSAARIGYMHVGGNGPTVGTCALVAATDDGGTRDFTSMTAAGFRKMATPKRFGLSFNSVKTDGTEGWRQVTWSGVSSKAMPDAGAGKVSVTWSDMIQVEGAVDGNGMYPLLVRMYHGTGPHTRIAALIGMQTAGNYAADVTSHYCATIGSNGDAVTTPGNWSDADTPFTVDGLPILVEFIAADDVATVMFVGDSRFGVSSELFANKAYLSTEALFCNAWKAAGKRGTVIGIGLSGRASSVFEPLAARIVESGVKPTAAVFLAWTVNDGPPTSALTAIAKYRMLEFMSKCGEHGIRPIIVTAFPAAAGFSTGQLAALADIKALAQSITADVIDPMALYGNANGTWKAGYAFDDNHMLQIGYADLAGRIVALI